MTATQSLRIIDFFKHHNTLNQNNVNEFLVIVDEVVKEEVKVIKDTTATKIEVNLLSKDIQLLQQETRNEFNLLRKETSNEFNLLRQEMKTSISDLKAEMRAETNKLVVWLITVVFGTATLFFAIAKFFPFK
jgi:hypothetical protein